MHTGIVEQMKSSLFQIEFLHALLWNHSLLKKSGSRLCSLSSKEQVSSICFSSPSVNRSSKYVEFLKSICRRDKRFVFGRGSFVTGFIPELRRFAISIQKELHCADRLNNLGPAFSARLIVGVMIFMTLGATVTRTPSLALSEENLLFLEAWRTIDRAYVDKTFNGQSWFRYRENALRNEPMNTRQETYAAIRKMVSTLDDPFTRFLEPQKFKSLRVQAFCFDFLLNYLTVNKQRKGISS